MKGLEYLDLSNEEIASRRVIELQQELLELYKSYMSMLLDKQSHEVAMLKQESEYKLLYNNHQTLIAERNRLLSKQRDFQESVRRRELSISQMTKILKDKELYHLYDPSC